jgi:hypothetical protein
MDGILIKPPKAGARFFAAAFASRSQQRDKTLVQLMPDSAVTTKFHFEWQFH